MRKELEQAMISLQGIVEFRNYICLLCGYICLKKYMMLMIFSFFTLMHFSASFYGGCLQQYFLKIFKH